MAWPETVISSWMHLGKIAAEIAKVWKDLPGYICRGHADATWTLKPSFVRMLPEGVKRSTALEVENRSVETFKAQAHLHIPHSWLPPPLPPAGLADWWALMQHYSAPTRLLDWTFSLYASTYFAASSLWDREGAILIVQGGLLTKAMNSRHGTKERFANKEFVSDSPEPRLIQWTPTRQTDRLVAQQGTFTVSLDVLADHGELVESALASTDQGSRIAYMKLLLPGGLKPEFMLQLRSMNITAQSLFPGADGLGRTVGDVIRVSRAMEKAE